MPISEGPYETLTSESISVWKGLLSADLSCITGIAQIEKHVAPLSSNLDANHQQRMIMVPLLELKELVSLANTRHTEDQQCIANLSAQLARTQQKNQQLEDRHDEDQDEIASSTAKLATLRSKCRMRKEETQRLREEVQDRAAESERHQTKNVELRARHRDAQASIKRLEELNAQLLALAVPPSNAEKMLRILKVFYRGTNQPTGLHIITADSSKSLRALLAYFSTWDTEVRVLYEFIVPASMNVRQVVTREVGIKKLRFNTNRLESVLGVIAKNNVKKVIHQGIEIPVASFIARHDTQ